MSDKEPAIVSVHVIKDCYGKVVDICSTLDIAEFAAPRYNRPSQENHEDSLSCVEANRRALLIDGCYYLLSDDAGDNPHGHRLESNPKTRTAIVLMKLIAKITPEERHVLNLLSPEELERFFKEQRL